MTEEGTDPRTDRVVIMARGESRRMGFPKGAAAARPGGPTLLALVANLYSRLGLKLVVVTLPELVAPYRALLEPGSDVAWVAEAAGGDTARTVRAAWDFLRVSGIRPARLWAHPVDMPLVRLNTLLRLRDFAARHPGQVVRPSHGGNPGHPVVFPWEVLGQLFPVGKTGDQAGPMRDLLAGSARAGSLRLVRMPVQDEGVVRDFADPTALGEQEP